MGKIRTNILVGRGCGKSTQRTTDFIRMYFYYNDEQRKINGR